MTVDTVPTGGSVVSRLLIYRFAPETKGRQLEAVRECWENGGAWPEPADRGSRTA
jgi:SP family galactose:H+ symporter-like MFS transporter